VGAFEIERTEVSNRQFRAFLYEALSLGTAVLATGGVDAAGGQRLLSFNASKIRYDEASDAFVITSGFEEHPVVGVSWYGARGYAQHYGLRLPTEAEWEKAARGASTEHGTFESSGVGYGTMYPWGSTSPTPTLANYGDNLGRTSVVTSHAAGASTYWGSAIYHLSGNVWEWCEDWYGLYSNPHQPPSTGTNKVLRGGSYDLGPEAMRVGARSSMAPTALSTNSGFRCAR
jgi:formylglycine-generating enzyme required for sulfatase activity